MFDAHRRLCARGAACEKCHRSAGARLRRALSHVGGKVGFRGGTSEERALLTSALDVGRLDARQHVHGFHSYPARLHPVTAERLIRGFSEEGSRVLDPFCGSGTVVAEARRLGRRALGSDLNPLALELSWLKTLVIDERALDRLHKASQQIGEFAEERRLAKKAPLTRYPEATRRAFPVHVLLELDSLRHGIRDVEADNTRRALTLALSSLLTKVSNFESDSSQKLKSPRLRSGFAIDLFLKKTKELCERLRAYRELGPQKPLRPLLFLGDARQLSEIKPKSIDFLLSSPPYPGVFDYLEHHRLRLDFLGLENSALKRQEIGARRNYEKLGFERAVGRWRSEFLPCLGEMARVLAPQAHAALVVADSAIEGKALRADEQLPSFLEQVGLELVITASQVRPSFHRDSDRAFRGRPRREHLLLLRK